MALHGADEPLGWICSGICFRWDVKDPWCELEALLVAVFNYVSYL